ncbi:MAG: sigma-70 family RNA polymerase sigma factor [Clostridia bacterium]|nr:sigma-70 family RNA polymerase sigma factor [Clostridia bacterium]
MLDEQTTLHYVRLAKQGDKHAKEVLLVENTSLLKCIVKRYLKKGVEYDDLMQLASIGFLKALNGFNEEFGVRLSTYAVPMIAGEIKRFMRDDGAIKVSRALKRTAKDINAFIENYSISHGEQPKLKTVAEFFDMSEADVVFALDSCKMPLSIHEHSEYKDEKTQELIDRLPVKDTQEEMIEHLQLHTAIESLPERERKIIVLRYFRDMTQSEVAKQIGVSQVQISRIEMKIMKDFKLRLAE